MHVAVVLHSLCGNNVGRVYPFLQAFQGSKTVQLSLIGWREREDLFPLLESATCRIIALPGAPTDSGALAALTQALPSNVDLIHCFKNREHLRHAATLARANEIPLVLDLDDWELGLDLRSIARRSGWRRLVQGPIAASLVASGLELEELARTVPDALTVNSSVLQAYFGGTLVYTAADPEVFRVSDHEREAFRAEHGIGSSARVVGFLGVPHDYKGIDDLLVAFRELRAEMDDLVLLVTGITEANSYSQALNVSEGVVGLGFLPAGSYPAAYAACDVIAIPQRARSECLMQTPAKLVLAMAAGRPIVSTRVGDIPTLLEGCGVVISPGDPSALKSVLATLLTDRSASESLGRKARKRFEERLTFSELERAVFDVYWSALRGKAANPQRQPPAS